jgi:uncharacterized LabA/DUF88 family protein
MKNIAFIDGQNLYLGMKYHLDNERFRIYLKEKYNVKYAYYFLGYIDENMQSLYNNLQKSNFILVFRHHNSNLKGKKKGNVDTDIVFEMMKSLIEEDFEKIILVSGDGDYKKVVDYLIKKKKFEKIIFPNKKKASSLYKGLGDQFWLDLNRKDFKVKLEHKKRRQLKH